MSNIHSQLYRQYRIDKNESQERLENFNHLDSSTEDMMKMFDAIMTSKMSSWAMLQELESSHSGAKKLIDTI